MRVIHEFVDNDGKTNFDEFESSLPLDMHSLPGTAHVLLMMRSNARRIAELWKECSSSRVDKRLYIGCPGPGVKSLGEWESAKVRVREMCFENPAAGQGGLRVAKEHDYSNARVVAMARDIHGSIVNAISEGPEDQRTDHKILKTTMDAFKEADSGSILATVSAHPLWKRLSWIEGFHPVSALHVIGAIVDPTWYVHPDDPSRCGLFKERCGVYNMAESLTGSSEYSDVCMALCGPYIHFIQTSKKININKLRGPGYFFLRYAMRWMQYYLSVGEDEQNAFVGGCWRYLAKLSNFIWLSWMEAAHSGNCISVNEERFFMGDAEVAKTAYRAAVS